MEATESSRQLKLHPRTTSSRRICLHPSSTSQTRTRKSSQISSSSFFILTTVVPRIQSPNGPSPPRRRSPHLRTNDKPTSPTRNLQRPLPLQRRCLRRRKPTNILRRPRRRRHGDGRSAQASHADHQLPRQYRRRRRNIMGYSSVVEFAGTDVSDDGWEYSCCYCGGCGV